jgi:ubiquinol-cytochrome c reductase cytochrome b subunit
VHCTRGSSYIFNVLVFYRSAHFTNKRNFFSGSSYYNNNYNNNKIIKLTSSQRIGPHNIDIISLIIGSTLGDTHLEKRKRGIGTRIIFEQCSKNVEYLM